MSNRIEDDDLSLTVTEQQEVSGSSDTVEIGSPGKASLASMFGQRNRKRMFFIVGAFAFLIVALVYSFFSFEPSSAPSQTAQGTGGTTTGGRLHADRMGEGEDSWLQSQERDRYNYEALPEVQRENPAAHPLLTPGIPVEEVVEVEPEPLPPPSPFVAVDDSEPQNISQAVGVDDSNTGPAVDPEMMNALIASLMEREGDSARPQLNTVSWGYAQRQPSPQPAQQGNAGGETSQVDADEIDQVAGAGVCASPLMRAGRMTMATTDMALNSDVGGPVAVTIRSGPLRNAQLIGGFERAETWLRINLNRLVTADETLSISAIALDMDTTLNAVEGDVDRHIMERYGWWGIGTVLNAIGKAAESNADSRIVVSDGTVIQDMESDSKRETKIALGELGQDLGEIMQDRLNRPITVSLNVGDEIGIFFLDDVCSEMPTPSGA